jgi:hypothetical protein
MMIKERIIIFMNIFAMFEIQLVIKT